MTGETAAETRGEHRPDPADLPLPPGTDGYPLVGSTLELARDPYGWYDTLAEYGDVVRYSAFGVRFTGVIHPEYVERVLLHDHGKYEKWAAADLADLHFAPEGLVFAKHEDARARLDEEHAAVLGGEPPTLSDLGDLTYTEGVIDEALRLYPPAYILFREASEDVALGGYRIPEGTKVVLPPYHVHTDERWYDEPERFRPERWTDEFEAELPDYAYFPFGGGPRHCIGMRFATMELKHVVPTVAQAVDFELLSDPDPEFTLGVTLRPAEDVRMRVHVK